MLYHHINNISPQSRQGIRQLWEDDLDLVHSSSPCARHSLIQLNIILRVHWTKAKLAKIFPDVYPSCPHCKSQPADLLHMFWPCPLLRTSWTDIFQAYSTMSGVRIPPNPICAIFGFTDGTHSLRSKLHVVIAFTSLPARRQILLLWKEKDPHLIDGLEHRCQTDP